MLKKEARTNLRQVRRVRWILNAAPHPERLAKIRSGKLVDNGKRSRPTEPTVACHQEDSAS